MATGNTLLSTVSVIKKSKPGKIVISVPVASPEAVENLEKEVDELIVLLIPPDFNSVGAYYENFENVSEDDVLVYLEKLKRPDRED
jgi:predicted phosphoribosyltransferase